MRMLIGAITVCGVALCIDARAAAPSRREFQSVLAPVKHHGKLYGARLAGSVLGAVHRVMGPKFSLEGFVSGVVRPLPLVNIGAGPVMWLPSKEFTELAKSNEDTVRASVEKTPMMTYVVTANGPGLGAGWSPAYGRYMSLTFPMVTLYNGTAFSGVGVGILNLAYIGSGNHRGDADAGIYGKGYYLQVSFGLGPLGVGITAYHPKLKRVGRSAERFSQTVPRARTWLAAKLPKMTVTNRAPRDR